MKNELLDISLSTFLLSFPTNPTSSDAEPVEDMEENMEYPSIDSNTHKPI